MSVPVALLLFFDLEPVVFHLLEVFKPVTSVYADIILYKFEFIKYNLCSRNMHCAVLSCQHVRILSVAMTLAVIPLSEEGPNS